MTPEEEVRMMNEDHEIWKRSKGLGEQPKITDYPEMRLEEQLDALVMDWRATSRYDNYKYSVFSKTRTLYIDWKNSIPLCTSDEHLAKLWLYQINSYLLYHRRQALKEIKLSDSIDINSMFSVRCVMLPIDPVEGDTDHEIAGMYYFGLVVSHYNSERNNIRDIAKDCEARFNSLK